MHIYNEFSYTYITTANTSSGLVNLTNPPTGYVLYQDTVSTGSSVEVISIKEGVYCFKYLINFPVNSTVGLLIEYIDPLTGDKLGVVRDSGKVCINEQLVMKVVASTGV